MDGAAMRQWCVRHIVVVAGHLADAVRSRPVGAKYHVSAFDSLRYSPQEPAGQPGTNLGLVGMCGQEDGNKFLIENAPLVRQLLRQVLGNIETGADEVPGETFLGMHALASKHD